MLRLRTINAGLPILAGPFLTFSKTWRPTIIVANSLSKVSSGNPKLTSVLGERSVASIQEIAVRYDLLDVFRAPHHLPGHVDEILALANPPTAVWFQLGIRHDASAGRLVAAGIDVVQDRCLMVEHRRLLGPSG